MRLHEFVLGDNGFDEDDLFKHAKMWWNGDYDTQLMVEKILDEQGWEIGRDESFDNGGVFVQLPDDVDPDGESYMSWSAEELEGDE